MPRRTQASLYLLALVAGLAVSPTIALYWDSYGYLVQSLTGRIGGLLLGRPLFVLASHALALAWRASGGDVWSLEPLLRYAWLGVSALAAPWTASLARALGLSPRAAVLAGVCVALSPAAAHTAGALLTDGPSMAVTVLALLLGVRSASAGRPGLALASGAALGAATGLREQACLHALSLALLLPSVPPARRLSWALGCASGFALTASAPVLWAIETQPGYLATLTEWRRAMALERAAHPYRLRDAGMYLAWLVALGPAALAGALACALGPTRRLFRPWTPAFAVSAPAALQLLALAAYQDIAYSPRYLLAALPSALALPAGAALAAWTSTRRARALGTALALALPAVLAVPLLRASEAALTASLRGLPARLSRAPRAAAVVTGQPCPAVNWVRRASQEDPARWPAPAPSWRAVCPGWRWPTDLTAALEEARREGRGVVLDLRPTSWLGEKQRRKLSEVRRYALTHRGADVTVWE